MIADLTPKRRSGGGGTDRWYPYYAGFTSSFARAVLGALSCASTTRVLDPWGGSGTTMFAASTFGAAAVSIDLNPFAAILARAKLAKPSEVGSRASLVRLATRAAKSVHTESASSWAPDDVHRQFVALRNEIVKSDRVIGEEVSPTQAFLLIALLSAARSFSFDEASVHPTWPRRDASVIVNETLRTKFIDRAIEMARDLPDVQPSAGSASLVGDSRAIPLEPRSVDVVLTSPPYCTRIDYAVATSYELRMLGLADEQSLRTLRRILMGTTASRSRELPVIPVDWSADVKGILNQVRLHPSHGSTHYYFKNLHQYFSDLSASLCEIERVLVSGGSVVVVAQNSYYKNVPIDLAQVICAELRRLGLKAVRVRGVKAWPVMTSLNSRAKAYLKQREYFEDLVVAEKL